MSRVSSVHSLLDEEDWNVEDLTKFLERDSTTINDRSLLGDPPLVRVLKTGKCTPDIVKLLLDHGASVTCSRPSPLVAAVRSRSCDAVINELLQRGADVRDSSCICNALQVGAPKSVFKLLLDAGCSPNACRDHVSVLHCASLCSASRLEGDVLQLFLEAGADVHRFGGWGRTGQSPLCFALRGGVDVPGLQLLLKTGISLDACNAHASTLLCATDHGWGKRLSEEVVATLIDAGANTGEADRGGWTPLQRALRYCKYEKGAIKALLNLPGVNINGSVVGWKGDTLLHLAVDNSHCKLDVLQLLVSRGAKLDKRNLCEDTALHLAVMNDECHAWVVNFLLEKGSPVNKKNKYGKTPLRVAIERERSPVVLHLLLAAGARLGVVKNHIETSLLKLALDMYTVKRIQKRLDCLKVIMKYSILENSDIAIEYISQRLRRIKPLLKFAEECVFEMQKMALKDVGHGRTLKEFLGGKRNKNPESNYYDFNRLLKIISDKDFPIFFTAISVKIGSTSMKALLRELRVYSLKQCFGFSHVEQKLFLNCDCVSEISQFLSTADMLRLVLAFYVPHDLPDCGFDGRQIGDNDSQTKKELSPIIMDACNATHKESNDNLCKKFVSSPWSKCRSPKSKAFRRKKKCKYSSFPPALDSNELKDESLKSSEHRQRVPKRKRGKERKRTLIVKTRKEIPVNVPEKNCVRIS